MKIYWVFKSYSIIEKEMEAIISSFRSEEDYWESVDF